MSIHAIDLLRFFAGPIATVDVAHTSGDCAGEMPLADVPTMIPHVEAAYRFCRDELGIDPLS